MWLPVEYTAYALLKLSLVGAVVFAGSTRILLAWVLSCGGTVGVVSDYLFWRRSRATSRRRSPACSYPPGLPWRDSLPVLYQTLVWVQGRACNVEKVQIGLVLAPPTTTLALVGATGIDAPGHGMLAGQCVVPTVLVVPPRRKSRSFGQAPAPVG